MLKAYIKLCLVSRYLKNIKDLYNARKSFIKKICACKVIAKFISAKLLQKGPNQRTRYLLQTKR